MKQLKITYLISDSHWAGPGSVQSKGWTPAHSSAARSALKIQQQVSCICRAGERGDFIMLTAFLWFCPFFPHPQWMQHPPCPTILSVCCPTMHLPPSIGSFSIYSLIHTGLCRLTPLRIWFLLLLPTEIHLQHFSLCSCIIGSWYFWFFYLTAFFLGRLLLFHSSRKVLKEKWCHNHSLPAFLTTFLHPQPWTLFPVPYSQVW